MRYDTCHISLIFTISKFLKLTHCCNIILLQIFSYNFSLFILQQGKIVRSLAVLRNIWIRKFLIWQLFACKKRISKHLLAYLRFSYASIGAINWISFFYRKKISILRVCLEHSFIYNAD
jgi:hypothetical protein